MCKLYIKNPYKTDFLLLIFESHTQGIKIHVFTSSQGIHLPIWTNILLGANGDKTGNNNRFSYERTQPIEIYIIRKPQIKVWLCPKRMLKVSRFPGKALQTFALWCHGISLNCAYKSPANRRNWSKPLCVITHKSNGRIIKCWRKKKVPSSHGQISKTLLKLCL